MGTQSNAAAARAADPLRSYVATLREARGFSQPEVAQLAGMKARTYISWENGESEKIDVEVARAVVRAVGGAFEHLDRLFDMNGTEARQLAEYWLSLSPEDQEAARSGATKLQRIVALTADDPLKLDQVLRQLRDLSRNDPEVLALVSGFLAGLSSRGSGD